MDDTEEKKDQERLSTDQITNRITFLADSLWNLDGDDDGMVDLTVYSAKGMSHIMRDIIEEIYSYEKVCKMMFEEIKKRK